MTQMKGQKECTGHGRKEKMKYIEAEALKKEIAKAPVWTALTITEKIGNAPTVNIVRCQDCKYWVYNFNGCSRNPCTEPWYATDFCNYGERECER